MVAVVVLIGEWKFAPLAGWISGILFFVSWTWFAIWRLGPVETKTHAVREDPGRTATDILLIIASIASLAAVLFLLLEAHKDTGMQKAFDIVLGLGSVVISWLLVHTIFTLKYARLYYGKTGGEIDFNEKDSPQYTDFAYLAFTLGMTFQVSDTALRTKEIRATALKHALLSYMFGTVIIATTINTLASLTQ